MIAAMLFPAMILGLSARSSSAFNCNSCDNETMAVGCAVRTLRSVFKSISPQSHRGHREMHCIVNDATGAVNKVKLSVLCDSVVNGF